MAVLAQTFAELVAAMQARLAATGVLAEIEFEIADGPAPGRWSGVAGMIDAYREVMNAWEGYSAKVEEYRELDGERVLVLQRLSGRGKTSGIELGEIQPNAAGVFYVHDGKVSRITLYYDRERAFSDLGLTQESAAAERLAKERG
jgi:hypothetical protein